MRRSPTQAPPIDASGSRGDGRALLYGERVRALPLRQNRNSGATLRNLEARLSVRSRADGGASADAAMHSDGALDQSAEHLMVDIVEVPKEDTALPTLFGPSRRSSFGYPC
jgi:hypothetical protein